jgi:hypothetical protein
MISGMHLQQFHSLQKLLYFCMSVWMPWTLTNGKAAMQGKFTTFLLQIIELMGKLAVGILYQMK